MLTTLALRHLRIRPVRSLVLLLGFALGVAVMIVLLSVGEAMLEQSRDVALVGGGDVTLLPQGIDVEAIRTGGVSAMYFGIDRARYVSRQVAGGPRERAAVRAVAPAIDNELLYLTHGGRTVTVRAEGEIPSRAAAVGAGLTVLAGRWEDTRADSIYVAPTPQQLYDELDRFHHPPRADSSWAEWHYFNVVVSRDEWWYVTYLIGGAVGTGRWGGQLLVTRRRPDGVYERFRQDVPSDRVAFDTTRADLTIGDNTVRQRDGTYHLRGQAGSASIDLAVRAEPHRYFPPVHLRDDRIVSGYVVPGLRANATGRLCVAGRCVRVDGVPAYHDHNWGTWEGVTWEWGMARGATLDLLYGGVYGPGERERAVSPFFLTVVDSAGVRQVLRFREIAYEGSRPARGARGAVAPAGFTLLAARGPDSLRLRVQIDDAVASEMGPPAHRRHFLQMRGRFTLEGRVAGRAVADSGGGFFETYLQALY